jgi:two-component system nitrate/nitrite response regulator NarL
MIRVALVNSIKLMCNVIAAVLSNEPDIEVAGCTTTVDGALALAGDVDVLVISTRLPNKGALRLAQAVARAALPVKVVVLGLAESKEEILQYVEAGVAGYVLQDDSVDDLLAKIRTAYGGEAIVSPEMAAVLITRVSELAQQAAPPEVKLDTTGELTPREREILELIGQGLSNQEIADRLVIEVGTVKNHVHSILQKLNVSDRQAAAGLLNLMR